MPLLTIDVTADDIAKGQAEDCYRCPIALAVRRAVGMPCDVESQSGWIEPGERRPDIHFKMPESARKFVVDFDNGREVSPFSFVIDVDLGDDA